MPIKTIEDVANLLKHASSNDLRELVAHLSSDGTSVRRCTMHAMMLAYNNARVKQPDDLREVL